MPYWTDFEMAPGFARGDIVCFRQPDSRHPRNARWWAEYQRRHVWRVQRMHNRRMLSLAQWPDVAIVEDTGSGGYANCYAPHPWLRVLTPLESLAAVGARPSICRSS